jgi:hypothetical protein
MIFPTRYIGMFDGVFYLGVYGNATVALPFRSGAAQSPLQCPFLYGGGAWVAPAGRCHPRYVPGGGIAQGNRM